MASFLTSGMRTTVRSQFCGSPRMELHSFPVVKIRAFPSGQSQGKIWKTSLVNGHVWWPPLISKVFWQMNHKTTFQHLIVHYLITRCLSLILSAVWDPSLHAESSRLLWITLLRYNTIELTIPMSYVHFPKITSLYRYGTYQRNHSWQHSFSLLQSDHLLSK